jgi:hypothetical protein
MEQYLELDKDSEKYILIFKMEKSALNIPIEYSFVFQ